MKLSKFANLVRNGGRCAVLHVEGSGIWLSTGTAIYRATELPGHGGQRASANGVGHDGGRMEKGVSDRGLAGERQQCAGTGTLHRMRRASRTRKN